MNYTLELENLKTESKAEIENQIKYISEENTDLRHKIRVGRSAEETLRENEIRLRELMECYLGLKEE